VNYPGTHGIGARRDDGLLMEDDQNIFEARFELEDTDGSMQTLDAFIDGQQEGDYTLLSSLRYTLIIEARVYQLQFHAWNSAFALCKCRPRTIHEGPLAPSDWWQDAFFFEQPASAGQKYQRMIKKQWDCVLLF
jgi:hypothetical protein